MVVEILLIVAVFILGRVAGGWNPFQGTGDLGIELGNKLRKIDAFLIGAIMGYLIIGLHPALLLAAVSGWLGEKPGVGWPKGHIEHGIRPDKWKSTAKPERWMFKALKNRPYVALTLRGVIWGTAFLPLAYFDWGFALLIPFYAMAMPAAMWCGKRMPFDLGRFAHNAWSWSESLQQLFVGLLIIVLT